MRGMFNEQGHIHGIADDNFTGLSRTPVRLGRPGLADAWQSDPSQGRAD
jgi:hypothetical protein